ncbi:MAG: glutathione S-transferase [Pseudomonadota bacterium]
MTYTLHIGDRTFSSWSLRGWLMLQKFGLPFEVKMVGLYSGTMNEDMRPLYPARLVPVLQTDSGEVIGESLAIAETLAERHPEVAFWPKDPVQRARARWLCAEMASGFSALRTACPMQLAHVNYGFDAPETVRSDVARIEALWDSAWAMSGGNEGWLFEHYSLADVFFAPVAARIIGYALPVSDPAMAYCHRTINDDSFIAWRQ